MEKKAKIKQIAASVFLTLAVILCISVVAQIMSRGYVTIFGHSLFRVATGSMEPTIETGALLISKETDINTIKEGDIICFRSKEAGMLGQVITHRVMSVQTDENGQLIFETRGDANTVSDIYYVTKENFIGIVTSYTKEGSTIAGIYGAVTSKQGFLAFIVLPVLLIAGLILSSSVNNIQKELAMLNKAQSLKEKQAGTMQSPKPVNTTESQNGEVQNEDCEKAGQEDLTNPSLTSEKNAENKLKEMMGEEEYLKLLTQLKEEIIEEVENSAK